MACISTTTAPAARTGMRVEPIRRRHWEILLLSIAVIVLASSMRVVHGDRVAFRLRPNAPLPHLCMSRALFGIDCPACGLTRSFILLAQGRWHAAYLAHPLGWIFALATALQIPYRLAALSGFFVLPKSSTQWSSAGLIILLFETWVLKMLS